MSSRHRLALVMERKKKGRRLTFSVIVFVNRINTSVMVRCPETFGNIACDKQITALSRTSQAIFIHVIWAGVPAAMLRVQFNSFACGRVQALGFRMYAEDINH